MIKKFSINEKAVLLRKNKKGALVPILAVEAALQLIMFSCLQNLRCFPSDNKNYLYDAELGYYSEVKHGEIVAITSKILEEYNNIHLMAFQYVNDVVKNILVRKTEVGFPIFDNDRYLCFTNGVLELQTAALYEFSPGFFITEGVPYPYEWGPDSNDFAYNNFPNFFEFMWNFCGSNRDRIWFLRAWLNALIFRRVDLQLFLFIYGPASTGKSTFATLATALVGKHKTVTTNLRGLQNDQFEPYNLHNKQLILISDTEKYNGDLEILKQVTGGDSLKGRQKFIQGSMEVNIKGLVLIVSNHPLNTKDTTQGITRRMRVFKADAVFSERTALIQYSGGKWNGPFADELPAIFTWAYSMIDESVYKYLVHMNDIVPSLVAVQKEHADIINPIVSWIEDQLEQGGDSDRMYIGSSYVNPRIALYDEFQKWYEINHGEPAQISLKSFSMSILDNLRSAKITAEKKVTKNGVMVIKVKIKVL